MSLKLSICIPTYNRGDLIGETLESIISQATEEVEIVISDNASTDKTYEIVSHYQQRFPRINYFCWKKNMGADNNYLKVVELAKGDYCWFMGSDDRIEEGGIAGVLDALAVYPNLTGLTVNCNTYDVSLENIISERPLSLLKTNRLFDNAEEAFSFLATEWGYISVHVINRNIWIETVTKKDCTLFFNAYVHVYIFANMLLKSPRWLYLSQKCVAWRTGNDSFLKGSLYRRMKLDVVGYENIGQAVFGKKSIVYDKLMKTVSSIFVFNAILMAEEEDYNFYIKSLILSLKYYWKYPIFWYKTFPIIIISILVPKKVIYNTLIPAYRKRVKTPLKSIKNIMLKVSNQEK